MCEPQQRKRPLTLQEAADMIGVTPTRLMTLVNDGRIEAIRGMGERPEFRASVISDWLARRP